MPSSTLQVAWRNLGRNRKRTALAVAAIALGQLTLVAVNGMMAGAYADMVRIITGPMIGHVQIHHARWAEERAIDMFLDGLGDARAAIAALPAVRRVSPRIYAAVLAASGEKTAAPADAEPAMIVGVDVAVETGRGGLLESLPPAELPAARQVVLGKVLANRLGVRVGQSLAIIGQDADEFPVTDLFTVRAIVRSGTDVVNRLGVVLAIEDAQRLLALADKAHEIVVHGADERDAGALAARIRSLPALSQATVLPWREAAPELAAMIDMKDGADLIFVVILFVAAAAGIANTMMMSTFERTREFGMLLAVGTRPSRIVRMVLAESVGIGLIGVAVGSVLGALVVWVTGHTGIDYAALTGAQVEEMAFQGMNFSYVMYPEFEFRHVLLGLVAVILTSALTAVWPAVLVARLEPVEAMRA